MQTATPLDQISERQQIELEMLHIFQKRIRLSSHTAIGSVFIIGYFVWYFAFTQNHLNIWMAYVLILAVFSTGYIIQYWFKRYPPPQISTRIWKTVFEIYSILCGSVWGLHIAYISWNSEGIGIAVVTAILLCVCSVSVCLAISQLYCVWLFTITTILPTAICLIIKGTHGEILVGMLLLLGLSLLIMVAYEMHQSLRSQLHTEIQLRRAVNEAQQARAQADQANSFKSQFLANVSHEIRTPMNAVLGMLKLLQYTELTDRQWDYTVKGEGAAKAMLGVLNDILDFSKIEAGKVVLDLQPLHIANFMNELMELLQTYATHKPIQLRLDIDATAPEVVLGDTLRLRQILMNLGGNAIKFTERGEVVVRVRNMSENSSGNMLRFEVEDTGIGIAPEKQLQIFEEFTQAENSTTRRFGGTGLGLSISKQLLKAMGGDILLDSTPGRGSNFAFELHMQSIPSSAEDLQYEDGAYWSPQAAPPT